MRIKQWYIEKHDTSRETRPIWWYERIRVLSSFLWNLIKGIEKEMFWIVQWSWKILNSICLNEACKQFIHNWNRNKSQVNVLRPSTPYLLSICEKESCQWGDVDNCFDAMVQLFGNQWQVLSDIPAAATFLCDNDQQRAFAHSQP